MDIFQRNRSRYFKQMKLNLGVYSLAVLVASSIDVDADGLPLGFVKLRKLAPDIQQDIRYATPFNFSGAVVPGYNTPDCVLTTAAANAIIAVDKDLNKQGLALKIFDCYRPVRSVRYFNSWVSGNHFPVMKSIFFPDIDRKDLTIFGYIASKSSHSRGSTVDVGLVHASDAILGPPTAGGRCDGKIEERPKESSLDMGTTFDCFSAKSRYSSNSVEKRAVIYRTILRNSMMKYGFRGYDREWWHFTLVPEPFPDREFDFVIQ